MEAVGHPSHFTDPPKSRDKSATDNATSTRSPASESKLPHTLSLSPTSSSNTFVHSLNRTRSRWKFPTSEIKFCWNFKLKNGIEKQNDFKIVECQVLIKNLFIKILCDPNLAPFMEAKDFFRSSWRILEMSSENILKL